MSGIAVADRSRPRRYEVRGDDPRAGSDRRPVEQEDGQPIAVELGELVGQEAEAAAKTGVAVHRRREVLGELREESRNLPPDDLVVMTLPGAFDQGGAVVGEQQRAAGQIGRREIVAEGQADEGRREIVARHERLQAGAPARLHVRRRSAEKSRRRPQAGRRRLAALERVRQGGADGRGAE